MTTGKDLWHSRLWDIVLACALFVLLSGALFQIWHIGLQEWWRTSGSGSTIGMLIVVLKLLHGRSSLREKRPISQGQSCLTGLIVSLIPAIHLLIWWFAEANSAGIGQIVAQGAVDIGTTVAVAAIFCVSPENADSKTKIK
ncbi:MAG: hypothetical protein D6694_15515 [Gammaproteobacteria bacterium]|nr:MAG: hypothetical protein D6694_15515 [Gammaproteobacteria bacterium]